LTRSNEEEKGARSTRASGRFIPEEAEAAGRGRWSAALLRADRDDGDGLACLRRRREADPIGDGRIRAVGAGSRRIRRRSRAAAGSQRRTPWRWRRGALQGRGERLGRGREMKRRGGGAPAWGFTGEGGQRGGRRCSGKAKGSRALLCGGGETGPARAPDGLRGPTAKWGGAGADMARCGWRRVAAGRCGGF